MRRLILAAALVLGLGAVLAAQAADTPLVQALAADPVQAAYLSRHPEILRWIGKHPEQTPRVADRTAGPDEKAKNNAINEWIADWPDLARLLARYPDQALAWADEPRPLADLGKKGKR